MNFEKVLELVKNTKSIILDEAASADITVKGKADFVTRVDYGVQSYLKKELSALYPSIGFYSEEQEINTFEPGKDYWILDPIDGTTNLIHHYQESAVSLGLYEGGRITLGIIYNPFRDECFTAQLGKGAFLNGRPIHVSDRSDFSICMFNYGTCPYRRDMAPENFQRMLRVYMDSADFRSVGACALNMAYVAAGRTDGAFEPNLKPWDYAAASLIIEEAGGRVTLFDGSPLNFASVSAVVCSNGLVHEELLKRM